MSRYDDPDSPDYNDTNVGVGMIPERTRKLCLKCEAVTVHLDDYCCVCRDKRNAERARNQPGTENDHLRPQHDSR